MDKKDTRRLTLTENRINIPADFLKMFEGNDIVVTCSRNTKCLQIYSKAGWEAFRENVKSRVGGDWERENAILSLYDEDHTTVAEQGRIKLQPAHIAYANLEKKVAYKIVGGLLEFWNEELLEERQRKLREESDTLFAGLFS